jgi:hypothetical protein
VSQGHQTRDNTFFAVIEDYAEELEAAGQLILSDVEPTVRATMKRAGHLDRLGDAYVLSADPAIGASTRAAYAVAQQWQTQPPQTGEQADRLLEREESANEGTP